MWDWNNFEGFDDETLIPVNLTPQEMSVLSSALTTMQEFDDWTVAEDFYQEVEPLLALLAIILRDEE